MLVLPLSNGEILIPASQKSARAETNGGYGEVMRRDVLRS